MNTLICKGEQIQEKILLELRREITTLKNKYQKSPGIAFIGFEGIPLAKYTIPLHVQMAESLGINTKLKIFGLDTNEEEIFLDIDRFNHDNQVNAIIILQPVPVNLNAIRLSNRIIPEKEVEGFHPVNMLGTMIPDINISQYSMLLPDALLKIFKYHNIEIKKDQLWVFLLDDDFYENRLTKMIVHSAALKVIPNDNQVLFINRNSENISKYTKMADFLVIVTKFPEYVEPTWLKEGVCIIDIYSNLKKEVPSKNDPFKLVPIIRGGINVESVKGIASAIVPVPGGLMTVVLSLLFKNTILSFKKYMTKENGKKVNIM